MAIRKTCADWSTGVEPTDDPFLEGNSNTAYQPPALPQRLCASSSTQLYMLRTMLESLCADDKKKSIKHEIDPKFYDAMLAFYHESYFYPYLVSFNGQWWWKVERRDGVESCALNILKIAPFS